MSDQHPTSIKSPEEPPESPWADEDEVPTVAPQSPHPASRGRNRRGKGRSRNSSVDSDASGSSKPIGRRKNRRRGGNGGGGGDLPRVDETTAGGSQSVPITSTYEIPHTTTFSLGDKDGSSSSGGKRAPRLRLDLNLDIEIHMKAKIRGDITLSLFKEARVYKRSGLRRPAHWKGTRIPVDWEFTPGVGYFLSLQNERFDIAVYVRMEPE